MTCVIAMVDGTSVLMASDSLIGGDGWKDITRHEKVFIEKLSDGTKIGVGFAGQPRVAQVLRYFVPWSSLTAHDDIVEWMVTQLVPAMKQACADNDVHGDDGAPGTLNGNLVVAVNGRVFEVQAHWQVHEPDGPFAIIGIDQVALGAVHAAIALGCEDLRRIMEVALEATARWVFGVEGPFHYWVVD